MVVLGGCTAGLDLLAGTAPRDTGQAWPDDPPPLYRPQPRTTVRAGGGCVHGRPARPWTARRRQATHRALSGLLRAMRLSAGGTSNRLVNASIRTRR